MEVGMKEFRLNTKKYIDMVDNGEELHIKRYSKMYHFISDEDYKILQDAKNQKKNLQEQVEMALEPFKKQIIDNLMNYPLSEEEYEEHIERFEKATKSKEMEEKNA